MKKRAAILAMLVLAVMSASNIWAADSKKKIKITLITMDSIDEHWLKVKAGAQAKANELGNIQLTFNAPPGKVDAAVQLQMVEDAITKRADVIMTDCAYKDAIELAECAKSEGWSGDWDKRIAKANRELSK